MNELLKSILDGIYGFVGNYGLSIIFFTLLIKLCLLPLDYKSRKGMRKMSALAPKQAELQKKYGHDQEKLNRKLQELYRKEGASPMAGCWPMLLTMPILFAMYAAMRYMANEQLVQQTFDLLLGNEVVFEPFLWVKNLWMPDSPFSGSWPTLQSLQMVETKQWVNIFNTLPAESVAKLTEILNIGELTEDAFRKGEALTATVNAIAPHLPVAQESAYLRINLLITEFVVVDNCNGLFILPILSAISQFTMTKLTEPQNPTPAPAANANGQQQPNSGAFMKWFFPLFSMWICASSNAAFALYWVITNLFSLVTNLFINWKLDNEEKNVAANPEAATAKGGLK